LADGHPDEAEAALQHALALYTPHELTTSPPNPPLAAAAHRLYRHAARHGDEGPSMLALAVEQRFGDQATRERALQDWQALEGWLVDNAAFATETLLAHEELEQALEAVVARFPSPFLVERLADLYVARYHSATRAQSDGNGLGTTALRRIEITGYLLMRLYLRADDPEGAREALGRIGDTPTLEQLRAVLVDAFEPGRSARPLLSLAEQFVPEPDADPSLPYVEQSWGIIDNLSRRTLARFPKDPYVHLVRARVLHHEGLDGAAIHHLRRSVDLKDDVFETWQLLAELEQRELARLARRDARGALARLPELETLHARAVKLWSDRPIRPALPEAYFVVAEALYQSGQADDAERLLDKSLTIEALPYALDLLGTIALKRARFDDAKAHYEDLARLPHDEPEDRMRWEARAHARLGEIAVHQGDAAASTEQLRAALRQTNELIAQPAISAEHQADRYLDRGRLLFLLGEVSLAIDDYEHAADLAPGHVAAYSEPMLQLVSHGFYAEARSVFRRALDRDEVDDDLKLYFSLWLNDLALRQGESPDPTATAFLTHYEGGRWGRKLAQHARGKLSYSKLLDGASDQGERAEAFFYEGLRRWRSGDATAGRKLLEQVVATELMGFYEYDMAQAYLEWGDVPATARLPLQGGPARRAAR
ncbi:MAG: tetratricopeptide repeat protein, partial [Myxococcales bacterium]|nr:tetratricopeptide repeat protein [Myxococcales bacterium]